VGFSSPWTFFEARHYRGTTLLGVTLWERWPSMYRHGKPPYVVLESNPAKE
jgi:hypothetical protein